MEFETERRRPARRQGIADLIVTELDNCMQRGAVHESKKKFQILKGKLCFNDTPRAVVRCTLLDNVGHPKKSESEADKPPRPVTSG